MGAMLGDEPETKAETYSESFIEAIRILTDRTGALPTKQHLRALVNRMNELDPEEKFRASSAVRRYEQEHEL